MQDTFARALDLKAEQPLGQTCARDVRVSCIQVAHALCLAGPLGRLRARSYVSCIQIMYKQTPSL